MAARRRRSRRAGVAIALALGALAELFLFAVGASVLWSSLVGLGIFGTSLGAGILFGSGAAETGLDEDIDAGLSGDGDFG